MIEHMGLIIDRETWCGKPVYLVYESKEAHHSGTNTCTHDKLRSAKKWVESFLDEKTN
jgi:hypothetical protein